MKREGTGYIFISLGLLGAFVIWTVLVCLVDVQAIGPQGTRVGFATMNQFVHALTGVNFTLYTVTDWLGLVPIGVVLVFAAIGLIQWVKRKHLLLVDRQILLLGGFYLAVMAVFAFFEVVVINYRPVLIDGLAEASYPSSTTMLTMCVMPTAIMQLHDRIKRLWVRQGVAIVIWAFTCLMVLGRLLSGVHWMSDIIGGAIVSAGLVMMYAGLRVTIL